METVIKNEILPILIFFILFSIGFLFLEVLLVFVLNSLGRRHWEFVIDVLIKSKVHYGKLIRTLLIALLGLLVISIICFTPLVRILTTNIEMRIFAVILALLMALFYSVCIRKTARLDIEKKIYRILFLVVSLIIYVIVLAAADQSYGIYKNYLNSKIINPAILNMGHSLLDQKQERLLKQFREMNQKSQCAPIDYSQSKQVGVRNFTFVELDPKQAFGASILIPNDPTSYLKGRQCSDGENTFLLTEWGAWYWVTD